MRLADRGRGYPDHGDVVLPRALVKGADAQLVAAGAPPLTEMRRRVWRVIPKVLERGRIRPSTSSTS